MVPTITSISPTVGHSGGKVVVEVVGAGFALPPPPPPTGIVPEAPPSVAVYFGGAPALDVAVQSPTLLYAMAPISPTFTLVNNEPDWGPGVVDVTVQNLDATGAPVPGEVATLQQAFEYRRPDLAQESHATTTMSRLLEELARQVCKNVNYAKHTDWSNGGLTIDLGQIATMPALLVVDLEFPNSTQREQGPQAVDFGDGHFARRREPDAVDAVGTILGVAETTREIQNMMIAAHLFFKKHPLLAVPRASGAALNVQAGAYDQSGGTIDYTMEYQVTDSAKVTAGGNNSNVKTFAFAFAIRGIQIEDWPGVVEQGTSDTPAGLAHEATIGITSVADDVQLGMQTVG